MEFKTRTTVGFQNSYSNYQQISQAIVRQQLQIQQNLQLRNLKYKSCIDNYLQHLKKQVHHFQSTEKQNNKRNQLVSQAYQTAYDRILSSAQCTLRKIKQTNYQKKQFWNKLIKNNAQLNDLQLKKEFYQQKRDAQDRYRDAVDAQKVKKIPYNALLGKIAKNQNLKQWQKNNKQLQQKVYQGTKTINEWRNLIKVNNPNKYSNYGGQQDPDFIANFTQPHKDQWQSNKKTQYIPQQRNPGDFLKNFQKRQQY